jgi:hypothetical protein
MHAIAAAGEGLCCGLDLNQHTLSGTSPSKWQKPVFGLACACSRTHLFAATLAGVWKSVKWTFKDLQRFTGTAKRIMSQIR